jgi:outer membrane biosynthesis protein TonB
VAYLVGVPFFFLLPCPLYLPNLRPLPPRHIDKRKKKKEKKRKEKKRKEKRKEEEEREPNVESYQKPFSFFFFFLALKGTVEERRWMDGYGVKVRKKEGRKEGKKGLYQ